MDIAHLIDGITPVSLKNLSQIQANIDQKTKPPGSLGKLETLAATLAKIQGSDKVTINHPMMLVFAADHGLAAQGVSIAGSEVTQQMVANFLNGGAAINVFCKANNMAFKVIDAGIKFPLKGMADLIDQSAGLGTNDISTTSAMSEDQLEFCLTKGAHIASLQIKAGSNIIGFGEMGIGNTSTAAAICAAALNETADKMVGRGTGITDEQLHRKTALVSEALSRVTSEDPMVILQELGGFEIAQICGAMLECAKNKTVILVDGFIVTAAALLACMMAPAARDYMIFSHASQEQGHKMVLDALKADPLLDLELRLGEGSGAALALPLLRAAGAFYNDMATFESAQVTV
ncbi:nicotinate-nucleotide--dimethylbenzimidazole phosphoribosyltransferase [Sneathiella sp.]|jgi:nicotinate-nucleotide--dimethylbenzimidazole phosphoribosyltransferase|uniref:nicotinate-nucleotide--dimethylbenzimidazole phosphoribosyltransferase n=1 Tax=Sneathiella sp. TaxID=1964365 RepID=UPI0039E39BC6